MPIQFIPFSDRVLVRPDKPETRPSHGLLTPESQQEKPTTGVVIAAGPKADIEWVPPDPDSWMSTGGVEVGERVQWSKYAGREVEINGEKLLLLRLEELDGRFVEVEESHA